MIQQPELIPLAAGDYLKQQRTARKLSLASVASAIILDEALLRKIEAGKAGYIAPVYMNGYIQAYANFLQIPQEKIQELIAQTTEKEVGLRSIFSEAPKRNVADNWLRASSYVLASLLIGTLAWQFTHEAVRLTQNGSRLSADSTSQQGQAPTGPVNASIASLDVLHDNPAGNAAESEPTSAMVPKTPLPAGEGRLQVSVSADSWVEISDATGRELEMDLLRGGSKKNYQGKIPFRILIGRASAVRLSMNGEAVDMAPYITDDIVQMTWPQQRQSPQQPAADRKPDLN